MIILCSKHIIEFDKKYIEIKENGWPRYWMKMRRGQLVPFWYQVVLLIDKQIDRVVLNRNDIEIVIFFKFVNNKINIL